MIIDFSEGGGNFKEFVPSMNHLRDIINVISRL